MGGKSELKKVLKEIVGANPNYPIPGTVTAIDGQTCSVRVSGGLVVPDVRLKSVISESQDYYMLIPAIGSDVLMLSGDGTLRNLTVIKVDQIQSFVFSQSGLTVEFDSADKKVKIENQSVNLKDLFQNLSDIIRVLKVQVITEGAPSGTPTTETISALNSFETSYKRLLK